MTQTHKFQIKVSLVVATKGLGRALLFAYSNHLIILSVLSDRNSMCLALGFVAPTLFIYIPLHSSESIQVGKCKCSCFIVFFPPDFIFGQSRKRSRHDKETNCNDSLSEPSNQRWSYPSQKNKFNRITPWYSCVKSCPNKFAKEMQRT